MRRTKLVNEILEQNVFTFRGLHDSIGFDFEKPFRIEKFIGRYTLNKIKKTYGITGKETAVILTKDKKYDNCLKAVTISGNIAIKYHYYGKNYTRPFDDFYAIKQFEELRKRDTVISYVIIQEKQHINKPVKKEVDFSERFKLKAHSAINGNCNGKTYLSQARFISETGFVYGYGNPTGNIIYTNSAYVNRRYEDVIDKSGYIVFKRREDLIRQAKALKAERDKEAANNTDFSASIDEMAKAIEEKKNEIISALTKATTYEEIKKAYNRLNNWRGFGDAVNRFEHFKESVMKKSFRSPEQAKERKENILEILANC